MEITKTSAAKPPIPKVRQKLIELPEDSGAIFQAVGIVPGDHTFVVTTKMGRTAKRSHFVKDSAE